MGGREAADRGLDTSRARVGVPANPSSTATTDLRHHEAASAAQPVRFEPRRIDRTQLRHAGRPAGSFGSSGHLSRYQWLLLGIDFVAALFGSVVAYGYRFGSLDGGTQPLFDLAFATALPLAWVLMLLASGGYERRLVGVGNAEFDRVIRAFLYLTVLTTFSFYVADVQVARGFALPALVLTVFADLLARYVARKCLHRRRTSGHSMTSVIAVGGASAVAEFTRLLRRDRHAGMRIVGACLPSGTQRNREGERELARLGIPVVGDVDSVHEVVTAHGAQSVAVVSSEISAEKLRWISWQLEGTDTDLVVSPGLAEIGGRRLHVQPVAGLPLLYIEQPTFSGVRRVIKAAFDRIAAGVALLVLSPMLLALTAIVALTSDGSPFFLQTRIGKDGKGFRMVKFRSMYVGADRRVTELQDLNDTDGPMFKMRNDPRVTPVGRILRRYSLDELPQLLNVLAGSMSMVGPRPPLPDEVAEYGYAASRRLLVKPGITGLWQISGRSDLSWEETVRLDLHYVENWSLALDMMVLVKTARAVVQGSGAY